MKITKPLRGIHAVAWLAPAVLVAAIGCTPEGGDGGQTATTGGASETTTDPLAQLPLGLDPYATRIPEDNPVTAAKVELGKHLYFDARLSKDGKISCATCHDPEKGWSDGRPNSEGINSQFGNKNSPTVINRVFSTLQFWDGRASSLEDQALGPVQNPIEMGNTVEGMIANVELVPGYKPLFEAAFGTPEITPDRVAKAIASFERTIVSGNSPFDRYEGGDKSAMSESAVRGLALFRDNNKGRCSICHAGFNFTDEQFHNIGVGTDSPGWEKDHNGRADVTGVDKDKGAFKTPTLRQLGETGPYMHDGSQKTLEEVVEFYNKGGHANPYLDKEMKALELTDQEKADLVAFLQALDGEVTKVAPPTPIQ